MQILIFSWLNLVVTMPAVLERIRKIVKVMQDIRLKMLLTV